MKPAASAAWRRLRIFVRNEIVPLQVRLRAFNDLLGVEAMQFEPPEGASGNV